MTFFPTHAQCRADLGGLQHFNDLRTHPGCTDFILDLLEFIETDLLRMDPNNRAKIGDIVTAGLVLTHSEYALRQQSC